MDIPKPDKKYWELAEKWVNGTATSEEKKEFDEWYNAHLDEPLHIPASFAESENAQRQRMLAYISKWKRQKTIIVKMSGLSRNIAIMAACLSAILLASIWLYLHDYNRGRSDHSKIITTGSVNLIEKINTSGKMMIVILPDSSSIQVDKDSRISYAKTYGQNNRKIYLEGAAIFDVKHNPDLPFKVYTSHLMTKVLGTKFHISAYGNNQKVVIAVMHGKIAVTEQSEDVSADNDIHSEKATGYVLQSNQQVIFDPASRKMEKSLVTAPIILHKFNPNNLQFSATPLRGVFHQLEKIYGISIVFDDTVLRNCTLTADLSKGSFYDKLEKICMASNLRYSEMDGHILIQGKGCNG